MSPWGLEISFVVKGTGAVILIVRLEYKTRVICHNVNTQNVKIARRDRPPILVSHQRENLKTFYILIMLQWGDLFQRFYTRKSENDFYYWKCIYNCIASMQRMCKFSRTLLWRTINSVCTYSCWICCVFYKISKLHESNNIFHSCLVS